MPEVTRQQRATVRLLRRRKGSPMYTLQHPRSGDLTIGWVGRTFVVRPDGRIDELERVGVE